MDKLITNQNGGYPFVLDDLRFADEAVREVLAGVCRVSGGATYADGFLLSNDSDIANFHGDYFPGSVFPDQFVFMENEIWFLPEYTTPSSTGAGQYLWVVPDIAFTGTAPGQKVFLNGSTNETYQKRRAKIVQHTDDTTVPSGYVGGFPLAGYLAPLPAWHIYSNRSSMKRFKDQSGLSQLNDDFTTLVAEFGILQTALNALDQRLTVHESAWTKITGTALSNNLWFKSSLGIGLISSFGAGFGILDAGSYLKFKKIGKTCFVSFELNGLVFPNATQSVEQIFGLVIGMNGIGTIGDITATCAINERDMISPISNVGIVRKHSSTQFEIYPNNFASESGGAFNWNYVLNDANVGGSIQKIRQGSGYAETVVNPKWTFRGSFVFELL